jgi:hypothetical protein
VDWPKNLESIAHLNPRADTLVRLQRTFTIKALTLGWSTAWQLISRVCSLLCCSLRGYRHTAHQPRYIDPETALATTLQSRHWHSRCSQFWIKPWAHTITNPFSLNGIGGVNNAQLLEAQERRPVFNTPPRNEKFMSPRVTLQPVTHASD